MSTEGPPELRGLAGVLFEAPRLAIFLLDSRLVVRDANPEACRLLACPRALVRDAPLSRWLVPGQEGVPGERILQFRTGRGRLRARSVRVRPDGSGGWVLIAAELPDASVAGEDAQRLAFLESLPRHFFVELTLSGRVRHEAGLDRTHLLTDGAAVGEPFPRLLRDDPADVEGFDRLLATVRDGGVWRGTQWHRRRDGETFLVRVFAAPRRNGESGRVEGVLLSGLDVERARLESERADRADRASAFGRLVGEVATILHRELRELGTAGSDPTSRRLESVVELAGDLATFRDVPDAPRRRLATTPLVERALGSGSGRPDVRVVTELPADLPAVHSVGPAAEKVLRWSLRGLSDIVAPGARTVRVEVAARLRGVVVSLRGEGAGPVDGERLGSLFEVPSDRVSGLHLPLAHALASAVGGRVWAWNDEEGGPTVLSVELPRFHEGDGLPDAVGVGGAHDARRRILVVDDDESVRTSVGRFLAEAGYAVDQAWSGRSAMARISGGRRPHVLVTDLRMLDGSGEWLLGELRRYFPELLRRTVIITGERWEREEPGSDLANCPVLEKPLELHVLLDRIDRLLG